MPDLADLRACGRRPAAPASPSSGRATSGLPRRDARVRARLPGRRLRHRRGRGSTRCGPGVLRRGRLRRPARGRARTRLPSPTDAIPPTSRASTSRSSRCRRRCATARPTSRSSRPRPRRSRRTCERGALVVLESTTYPGHHRGAAPADPRSRRACGPAPTSSSATRPSASTRATPTWTFVNTPKVVSGIDDRSLRAVERVLRRARRQGRPGRVDGRGRARQAAREHVPPRQHRARQRARDVRPRSRRRHLVGDRRRLDQAVRVHALHAGSRRRRSLPADRPVVPRVARRAPARASASGSSSSPTTSTATCPTTSCSRVVAMLNDHERAVKGSRILLLGLAYKPATSDWRESPSMAVAERWSRSAPTCARTTRTFPTTRELGVADRRVSACTTDELDAADLVVLLVDHPDLPYDAICDTCPLVLDTKGVLRGRPFRGEVL